ncbi:hypothetical protein [Pseudomonas eucalypticola]|uniref:Translation elongation factor EFTu/EF1A C-terminal domain-containing protein n=1 Tax=Pseudomonas eucalypticola TaxID=2599595 RepID=A0A7D5HNT7_9PSED|nr:hypothetical protein [Pseudomonas eucalypticola]QKZ04768.1 hypothetical protein HWQ56_13620 [Pseudomonas eucalypticola]
MSTAQPPLNGNKENRSDFAMRITRSFGPPGMIVVSGHVLQGCVSKGQVVEWVSDYARQHTTCLGIFLNNVEKEQACESSAEVDIYLPLSVSEPLRGSLLATPETVSLYARFMGDLEASAVLNNNARAELLFPTYVVTAEIRLPDGQENLQPEDRVEGAEFRLVRPSTLRAGEIFAIRLNGRLVGTGTIKTLTDRNA